MGEDKALLPWRDGTLLDNAVNILEELDDHPIVVVDELGKRQSVGEPMVVVDRYPGAGPLGGIVTGLERAGDGVHLVMACDLPLVEKELIRHLLMWAEMNAGADAIIPVVKNRDQSLLAMYHSRCLSSMMRSLESGERAVHRAIQTLNCTRIPESLLRHVDPELRSFANVNTREEYEGLWRQYGQP